MRATGRIYPELPKNRRTDHLLPCDSADVAWYLAARGNSVGSSESVFYKQKKSSANRCISAVFPYSVSDCEDDPWAVIQPFFIGKRRSA